MTQRKRNKDVKSVESIEVKEFVKILIIVLVVIAGIYFFTRIFITKDLFNGPDLTSNDTSVVEIDYTVTSIGAMLSRPYDDYYVMIYRSEENTAIVYNTIRSNYVSGEDSLKLYYVDLSTVFNKKYYNADETNPSAKTINDLKLGDLTLIRVRNGKISNYYEDVDRIKELLTVEK